MNFSTSSQQAGDLVDPRSITGGVPRAYEAYTTIPADVTKVRQAFDRHKTIQVALRKKDIFNQAARDGRFIILENAWANISAGVALYNHQTESGVNITEIGSAFIVESDKGQDLFRKSIAFALLKAANDHPNNLLVSAVFSDNEASKKRMRELGWTPIEEDAEIDRACKRSYQTKSTRTSLDWFVFRPESVREYAPQLINIIRSGSFVVPSDDLNDILSAYLMPQTHRRHRRLVPQNVAA